MTTTTHATVERIGDYLDGVLDDDARRAVAAHLVDCPECAARLAALQRLHAHAAAAPRSVAPPGDLWPTIRVEIASRGSTRTGTRGAVPRWRRAPALAAAALLIAAVSSVTTWRLVRSGGAGNSSAVVVAPPTAAEPLDSGAGNGDGGGRDALLRYAALERDYDRTAAGLRATLDAQRPTLAPETVATVERSLRTIDDAIAEARAALARDPGNQALVGMLTATHEQRLDLLRRATHIQSGA